VFGKVAIDEFEDALKIDLIVRAHQVVMDGYEFFHNKRCLTIFSAPCYCGEMNNIAGILFVSAKLECAIFTYRSPNRAPEEDEDQQIEDGKVGKEDGEKHLDGEIEKQKSGLVGKDTTKPGKQKLTPDQVEKKNREGSSLPCKNENTPSKEGANIRKEREQKKETADAKSIPKQEGYDSPKLKTTPRSSDNSNSAPYNEKQQNKKGDSKVIDRCKEKQNNDNKMVKGQSKKDTGTSSSTQKNESNKKQESESNKRKENVSNKKEENKNKNKAENEKAEKKEKSEKAKSNRSKKEAKEANSKENKGSVKELQKNQKSLQQKKVDDCQKKTVKNETAKKLNRDGGEQRKGTIYEAAKQKLWDTMRKGSANKRERSQ
ncbi:Serine/threonine-protein phosphatase PP-Z2, partial [Toxocara canis]